MTIFCAALVLLLASPVDAFTSTLASGRHAWNQRRALAAKIRMASKNAPRGTNGFSTNEATMQEAGTAHEIDTQDFLSAMEDQLQEVKSLELHQLSWADQIVAIAKQAAAETEAENAEAALQSKKRKDRAVIGDQIAIVTKTSAGQMEKFKDKSLQRGEHTNKASSVEVAISNGKPRVNKSKEKRMPLTLVNKPISDRGCKQTNKYKAQGGNSTVSIQLAGVNPVTASSTKFKNSTSIQEKKTSTRPKNQAAQLEVFTSEYLPHHVGVQTTDAMTLISKQFEYLENTFFVAPLSHVKLPTNTSAVPSWEKSVTDSDATSLSLVACPKTDLIPDDQIQKTIALAKVGMRKFFHGVAFVTKETIQLAQKVNKRPPESMKDGNTTVIQGLTFIELARKTSDSLPQIKVGDSNNTYEEAFHKVAKSAKGVWKLASVLGTVAVESVSDIDLVQMKADGEAILARVSAQFNLFDAPIVTLEKKDSPPILTKTPIPGEMAKEEADVSLTGDIGGWADDLFIDSLVKNTVVAGREFATLFGKKMFRDKTGRQNRKLR